MNLRVFMLLVTVTVIGVAIFLAAIPRGTAGTVSKTNTTEATSDAIVSSSKVANKLTRPRGFVDGAVNPQLIPDEVAYSLLFRLLAKRDTKEDQAKIRSYIKQMNVTDTTALLAVVNEFERRVGKLDRRAQKIHDHYGVNLDSQALAELNDLERQKNEIIAEIVQTLPERIDVNNLANIRTHVAERVKRNVKMIPEHVHQ